jgi:hypothetical protein
VAVAFTGSEALAASGAPAASAEDTRVRICESNSMRIRSSPRDAAEAAAVPAAVAPSVAVEVAAVPFAESAARASACSLRVRAVVATLAPAASFRNRRLLVRGFFTLTGLLSGHYACASPQNEDIRNPGRAKGAVWGL